MIWVCKTSVPTIWAPHGSPKGVFEIGLTNFRFFATPKSNLVNAQWILSILRHHFRAGSNPGPYPELTQTVAKKKKKNSPFFLKKKKKKTKKKKKKGEKKKKKINFFKKKTPKIFFFFFKRKIRLLFKCDYRSKG